MSAPIKTNQLKYKFDKELFSKRYDIFCIHTSEKYFKNGAYIIDAPLLSNNVCSVLFKSGKEFFVLMKNNDANVSLLKDAILKEDGADRVTISRIAANTLQDDIVFQLMLNLFEADKYNQCVEIFENAKINSEKIHGIIRDASGNINIIKDTGWFTIPEIDSIKAELANGNTKLRGREKRDELLTSCLDIKMFNDGVSEYYFVGTIGNGMRRLINRAANIRMIEPFEDLTLLFEKLLPLMNVTFVHNGQLTIIPFPFKYLREYIKSMF